MIRKVYNAIKRIIDFSPKKFDTTGERVDITFNSQIDFDKLDMYQKSHYRRYEYAVSVVDKSENCGDFACGTGYGSIMLSKKVTSVVGADINGEVIKAITKRYKHIPNIEFKEANLLDLTYNSYFDTVVSFETIEHFSESNIIGLLDVFNKSLKKNGKLIFSTPYMQENTEAALKMGHHLTFFIDETRIEKWLLDAGFAIESYKYQSYGTHTLQEHNDKKDFIICVARKK